MKVIYNEANWVMISKICIWLLKLIVFPLGVTSGYETLFVLNICYVLFKI